jgi:protein phosphatase
MQLKAFSRSDIGRVRYSNEDCIFSDPDAGVFAVADGVGGTKGGGRASQLFCDAVREHTQKFSDALNLTSADSDRRHELIALTEAIFQSASERIYQESSNNSELRGMATTGMLFAVGSCGAVLGHVGDSRAYLVRDNAIQRLTVDHTLAEEMVSRGLLREEELPSFRHKNILARAVGQLPTVRVDTVWLDIKADDSVLLCTDGLYRYFEDQELCDVAEQGIEFAVDEANARGGKDNLSAVYVKISDSTGGQESLDTSVKIRAIQDLFLFRYLSYQELVRILKIVFENDFEAGQTIFAEGSVGDTMYIVYSGEVEVLKGSLTLTTIGPGGHFGEIAFMDGRRRSASVVARKDTMVLTINRDDFRALTRTDPVVSAKLLWCFVLNLSGRVRELSQSLSSKKAGD